MKLHHQSNTRTCHIFRVQRASRFGHLMFCVIGGLLITACEQSPQSTTHASKTSQTAYKNADSATKKTNNTNKTKKTTEQKIISAHDSLSDFAADSPTDVMVESLTPDLLYHLLVAQIAAQRNQHSTAMNSLTRAAQLSHRREVVEWAMHTAMQREEHQRVIELSLLLEKIAPNDSINRLTRAEAEFYSGQPQRAWQTLLELARTKPQANADTDEIAELQHIATLIAEHSRAFAPESTPAKLLAKFRAAIAPPPWNKNPRLALTAALLAYELAQHLEFRTLIQQAERLHPGWEAAAILQLNHLAEFPLEFEDFKETEDEDVQATIEIANLPAAWDGRVVTDFAERFLREYPHATRFRAHYAVLLLKQQQTARALRQSQIALRQDADSRDALFASAQAYFQQKNLRDARAHLLRLLNAHPEDEEARFLLADLEITQENWQVAKAQLRQIQSDKHYFEAQRKLATVFAKQNGIAAGITHLEQIAPLDDAEAVHILLAQALLYQDFDLPMRAKSVLDEGLRFYPAEPNLLYSRGILAAELELLELHEHDMRAVIAQQPDNAHAHNALGYTLADQNQRLDEALELISTALKLLPHNHFVLDSMGWVHFRLGNHGKALAYLRRALAIGRDAEIAAHLGEVLWYSGHKDLAHEVWELGAKWEPDNKLLKETVKRFSHATSSVNFPEYTPLNSPFFPLAASHHQNPTAPFP